MVTIRIAICALLASGCGYTFDGLMGERWYEADVLFHRDRHWMAGDVAATVALDEDRTLWLFGDSYIAPAGTRIANSIAVMTGHDPLTATMHHAWQRGAAPGPMFGPLHPLAGHRAPGGPLIVLLADDAGAMHALRIADPEAAPESWQTEPIDVPPASFADGVALATCTAIDGDYLVGIARDPQAYAYAVRWPLEAFERGDLGAREWRDGDAWIPEAALAGGPKPIARDAPEHCSLMHDDYFGWLYVGKGKEVRYQSAGGIAGPYRPGFVMWWEPETLDAASAIVEPALSPDDGSFGVMIFVDSEHRPHVMRLMQVTAAAS